MSDADPGVPALVAARRRPDAVAVRPGLVAGVPDVGTAQAAAAVLLAGGLVALPTETVYGLAADARNRDAVARVFSVKGRPVDHPLIVHVAAAAAVAGWASEVPPGAARLIQTLWPGPLTVVLARRAGVGDFITGGQDTVALRCPAHPVALAALAAFAEAAGDPAAGVAAPSANRFGRVSPTSAADVVAELGAYLDPGRDLVVDGGRCRVGVESTIVDCTGAVPRLLRAGEIGIAQVRSVWFGQEPGPRVDGASSRQLAQVRAPGTLAAHYAPRALVVVWDGQAETISDLGEGPIALIAPPGTSAPEDWVRLAAPTSDAQFAHLLYASMRRADELGARTLVVVPPAGAGPLAEAVRDRLARAAASGKIGSAGR